MSFISPLKKYSTCERGLSYIEVMIAVAILAIALVPAMQAVQTGIQSAAVHENLTDEHYLLLSKIQSVSVESFSSLLDSAEDSGSYNTESSYSDPAGQQNRVMVFLSLYDADNGDGDGNRFTIADSNVDGDNNPYTTADTEVPPSILWIRVAIENTDSELTTLVRR